MTLATPTRRFVPSDLDAGNLDSIEVLFAQLAERAIDDVAALEEWLLDEGELSAHLGAEVARRYIKMTCSTKDESAQAAYQEIQEQILPRAKVLADQLDKKFLASPALDLLDADRYGVLIRDRRDSSDLFRVENTALQTEEAALKTKQQALMGGLTAKFEGREVTLQQLAPFYEDNDRTRREAAFRASLAARRPIWAELEDLFDQLVTLRTRMAKNAGCTNYVEYRFRQLSRFDYTPLDCQRFSDAVRDAVVPAVERLQSARREALGQTSLRPWDLEVDLDGRPPFEAFKTEDQLITLVRRVFSAVDPRFADEFRVLETSDMLDLMSRKGKAPGGYQYSIEDVRLPFIFANSVGTHQDVQTMLHEGGHAFHSLLSRDEDLRAYRSSPIEFAETASMSMELMGLEHLEEVYDAEDARAMYRQHLRGILRILPWIVSIDTFQRRIYEEPELSKEARRDLWVSMRAELAPGIDWSELEDVRAHDWLRQSHLFTHALYYVEYGIAQLAALQIWQRYRKDPADAVARYRAALALGGSKPLPELFAAAGVKFDLSAEMLRELVADIESAIAGAA